MKKVALLILLCLCVGCSKPAPKPARKALEAKPATRAVKAPNAEVDTLSASCVAVYDMASGQWDVDNNDRASEEFLPASTYKILHTLIALQSGLVDKNEVFKWDGVERNYKPWNQDLTLEQAFRHSAIWVYQRIARRIGPERMQNYVDLVGYGNRDISGRIDSFWLDGGLRITPRQQIWFLKQLYLDKLPFNAEHMAFVKQAMRRKSGEGWVMYAKTGWAQRVTPQIGWLVGWVERDGNAWLFATNVRINKRKDAGLRYELTEKRLAELGVLPAEKEP